MHYDLIIIGGGLVGRALACALRNAPLKIALLDAAPEERHDPRLIALNYGSISFLEQLSLWQQLEAQSAPIQEVHISHQGRFGSSRLTAKSIELPALGHVVRAQLINQALTHALSPAKTTGSYTELRPARVKAVEACEDHTTLSYDDAQGSQRISGRFIIAADGSDSCIRQLLNFDTETHDYQQSAIVTVSELSRSHQHIAYERFVDEGAIAMLPLHDSESFRAATIWTDSTLSIQALQQLSDQDFLQRLQSRFGYRLGRLKSIAQRHVFPLQFIRVKNPLKANVLLIGNAAHTIHPIAAQGLNLALYEIAHLSRALLKNLQDQQPLHHGLAQQLDQFQPKSNLLFSHYLSQLFSSERWGINVARQAGMLGFELCPPLKKQVSRRLAMENIKWLQQ